MLIVIVYIFFTTTTITILLGYYYYYCITTTTTVVTLHIEIGDEWKGSAVGKPRLFTCSCQVAKNTSARVNSAEPRGVRRNRKRRRSGKEGGHSTGAPEGAQRVESH